ncbi:MAG: TonB-dependent receptor plug domain-containing protein [Bacteroidaceae bacterium]|nr:TonB-dependent receptor plug domain-containing protein [Bacteroidaceae bacterium]
MKNKTVLMCLGMIVPALSVYAEGVVLTDSVINLQEVVIRDNFSSSETTPLSIKTLSPSHIKLYSTSPNYVEMMQGIPGVYATPSTGSYGDATLNIRGFKQENISVLLNGIPIQGLTSGSMYWNNWMGLAEATYAVQIQKGMGSSMLADCAMGGMVNIITKTGEGSPEWDFSTSYTQFGTKKGMLSYSTGQLKNGWSANIMVSGVHGDGFVETSQVKSISYLLSVSKILNPYNTLIFTAIGSPEQHDQRSTELSKDEVDKYGRGYSKNWGYMNGEKFSIARNHYFKPYFTLQHHYDKGALHMKNSLYLAIADGGGRSTYNDTTYVKKSIIEHQSTDGHIDFNSVIADNTAAGVSGNFIIDYLSGHNQAGAIVSADYSLNNKWTVSSGLQYQYFDTWSKMIIMDLLGADHYSMYGKDYLVGDYIGSRYGRTTHLASGYGQIKYDGRKINTNLGISVFSGNYRRHDDVTGKVSDWAHGWGVGIKSGLLYHITGKSQAFINLGYNSRLPYAGTFLVSSDLSVKDDVTNEENLMAEIGTRIIWKGGGLELSAYSANWKNKTVTVSTSKRANEKAQKYYITGLNALHMGVELYIQQQITPWAKLSAFANLASWKWNSSGEALIYDGYTNETLNTYKIYCDGLHVGDSPQTQFGAQADFKMPYGFYANLSWQFNDRMYADFEPDSRKDASSPDAYRLPSWNVLDATIGWSDQLFENMHLDVFATGRNLTDAHYIERGKDGRDHDLATFRGYWGAPRTLSIGMKLSW